MNIPKIVQLPSGMYRCQLRIDGQSISITDADRDTVEAKAYAYKAGILKARKTPEDITVGTALERYIDSRRAVLSPSTIRGYEMIRKHRFATLQSRRISALTEAIVQRDINDEAKLCSPKTLKNAYRLIESAIVHHGGESFSVKLPQIPPHEKLYLTPTQIPVFCEAIKGTEVEVAALLALWSCRRSELLALEWDAVDMENRKIKIHQSTVLGSDGMVTKEVMKNRSSMRTIPMIEQLYDALNRTPVKNRKGRVVTLPGAGVFSRINTICRNNKLPEVGLHGLRHSCASLCHYLNLPLKQAMLLGGWSDNRVMLDIYTHIADEELISAQNAMTAFYDAHGIAHEANGSA